MAARPSTTKTVPKAAAKPLVKAAAKAATPKSPGKGATPAAKGKTAAVAKAVVKPAAPMTVTLKISAGLAGRHGMEKKQADAVVADVFEIVVGHLRSGERVRINGLGMLEVKDRPARMGRNPATGEAVQIAASRKVAFRVAKDLKSTI